jgi:hypothetical protein
VQLEVETEQAQWDAPVYFRKEHSVLKKSNQRVRTLLIVLFLPKHHSIPRMALLEVRLVEHQQRVFQQALHFYAIKQRKFACNRRHPR